MKDKLIGIAMGLAIVAAGYGLLYPYYSLANLKDIADELAKIRKVIEDRKMTELVRCKDCLYWDGRTTNKCSETHMDCTEDDYCSFGEKVTE